MDKACIDFKRLFDIALTGAFFTVRANKNLSFWAVTSRKVDKSTGLRCDQTVRLSGPKSKKLYLEKLRGVKYRDMDKGITLVFLTNNFELAPIFIAALSRNHLQIEVFFRWI